MKLTVLCCQQIFSEVQYDHVWYECAHFTDAEEVFYGDSLLSTDCYFVVSLGRYGPIRSIFGQIWSVLVYRQCNTAREGDIGLFTVSYVSAHITGHIIGYLRCLADMLTQCDNTVSDTSLC